MSEEEALLLRLNAELASSLIEKAGQSGELFKRAFLNGTLSAIAKHLMHTVGSLEAYATFQRLADECAAPLLEKRT